MRNAFLVAVCGASLAAANARAQAPPHPAASAERRGLPFWTALVRGCEVPAGETAFGLVGEAASLLGSPDPRWRDDVGYGVVAACVYASPRLSTDERRALVARLTASLRAGLGATGDDSVLLRSFSALDLSVLAAAELRSPALEDAGYRRLLDEALAYVLAERDLRGLEPRVGWIHATAHAADLLKFLARDARFAVADQARLLEAVWTRMAEPSTPVFTHAEDERLAAAVASVVRRADFDATAFDRWLERFPALEKEVWTRSPPLASRLDAAQNARNLLRSLYVALSLPGPPAPGGEPPPESSALVAARRQVLKTLEAIRRS
jgi:hypothetical protein